MSRLRISVLCALVPLTSPSFWASRSNDLLCLLTLTGAAVPAGECVCDQGNLGLARIRLKHRADTYWDLLVLRSRVPRRPLWKGSSLMARWTPTIARASIEPEENILLHFFVTDLETEPRKVGAWWLRAL